MSYKIGLLLSMIFVALFFLFGADLLSIQNAYSVLDAKANNISYLISRTGVIDDAFINYVEQTFYVHFACEKHLNPSFGDEVTYQISTQYQPLVIAKEKMTIVIERMTIIGFYG